MVITFISAHLLIALACCWAVMRPHVAEGVLGKFSLIVLCFASIACAAWGWILPETVDRSETVFAVAAAGLAARCYWIKACRPVRRHIKRRIRKCN
jgi:hypothetical protein